MDDYLIQIADEIMNSTNGTEECKYLPMKYVDVKFWIFAVLGTITCLFGTIGDCILLHVLLKPILKGTYLIYYAALTFIDIGILITIFLVWIIHIVHDYFNLLWLYLFWLSCLPYFYPLSRLLTLSATYLIVACTIERYLEVFQLRYNKPVVLMNQSRRYAVIMGVLIFCILFRFPSIWEIQVIQQPNCTDWDWTEYTLDQTDLAKNPAYQRISFWMTSIVQVFVPFFILLVLNTLITLTWTKVDHGKSHSSRSARKMMIAIISSYLLCNLLNLGITVCEVVDKQFLLDHDDFYMFAADVVFFLTAINSSIRLPIYFKCNHKIRYELKLLFRGARGRNESGATQNTITSSAEGASLVSLKEREENGIEQISVV